jgi:hypothetical protein
MHGMDLPSIFASVLSLDIPSFVDMFEKDCYCGHRWGEQVHEACVQILHGQMKGKFDLPLEPAPTSTYP